MELPLPVDHSGVKYRKKRASDTNFEYINMNQSILGEFLGILYITDLGSPFWTLTVQNRLPMSAHFCNITYKWYLKITRTVQRYCYMYYCIKSVCGPPHILLSNAQLQCYTLFVRLHKRLLSEEFLTVHGAEI